MFLKFSAMCRCNAYQLTSMLLTIMKIDSKSVKPVYGDLFLLGDKLVDILG